MTARRIDLRRASCLDHAMTDLSTIDSAAAATAPHARRRTFAIISHPDAGKTTLTEKLLLFGGAIKLAGSGQGQGRTAQHPLRLDEDRARARHLGRHLGDDLRVQRALVFNLLDTPGHEDFSEDTYRTLTAVDSAVMVIDAAKGIEARTRKLFEVCRLRDIPIITFINKMDRESRDTFELLDEIEKTLALDTTPMTWPVGRGRDFLGTYDRRPMAACGCSRAAAPRPAPPSRSTLPISASAIPISTSPKSRTSLALASEACKPFDLEAFREGHLTPVYFGSCAARISACGDLLEGSASWRRAPRAQDRPICARRRGGRAAHERLRLQDPGQHGPEPSRPHRVSCPAVLGQALARHEGQAGADRQEHER
jgi:peptide chain release factor 3